MIIYTDDIVLSDEGIILYPAGVTYEATITTRHRDGTVDLEFERDGEIIKKNDVKFNSDGCVRTYNE